MANKVDQKTFDRIIELREKYGLTQDVIGQRLGLSKHTVKIYLRSHRTGTKPYSKCTTKT